MRDKGKILSIPEKHISTLRWYCDNGTPEEVVKYARVLANAHLPYPAKKDDSIDEQPGSGLVDKIRVALIVGHNERAQGAWAIAPLSKSEFVFNSEIARLLEGSQGPVEYKRFFRINQGSYSKEIDQVYAKAAAWEPDLILEMHFNWSEGGDYTTMLVASSASLTSVNAANHLNTEFSTYLNIRNAGVRMTGRKARGGRGLWATKYPTVLTEPFFGSNKQHVTKVLEGGEVEIAKVYHTAVAKLFNL